MVNIHPARAGVNLVLVDFDDLDVYLPRMRGGQPSFMATLDRPEEFSPHARGSTLRIACLTTPVTILPACAGVNLLQKNA